MDYPRDLIGYGGAPAKAAWPDGARIAVQFVLNYEEGGERCVLHGDDASETFLSDIAGAQAFEGARHMSMESLYEYGARAGVWRILELFRERRIPLTMFAVAMAARRNPMVIERALKDGHEIASHGLRWIDYHGAAEDLERAHLEEAVEIAARRRSAGIPGAQAPTRAASLRPMAAFYMTQMIIPTIFLSGAR